MGRDKAHLSYRGGTLADSVAAAVRAAAGSAVLVGDAGRGIPDLYPGEGPLGGILSALEHSQAEWNLVVACDMPALDSDFLGRLLAAAEAARCDAFIPAGPSGRLEPLCAVYRRGALAGLSRAFALGARKIATALEGIHASVWPVAEVSYFQNMNTPEDWAAYGR